MTLNKITAAILIVLTGILGAACMYFVINGNFQSGCVQVAAVFSPGAKVDQRCNAQQHPPRRRHRRNRRR